jgi:hypothetical protein
MERCARAHDENREIPKAFNKLVAQMQAKYKSVYNPVAMRLELQERSKEADNT